jgi:plastocyanin
MRRLLRWALVVVLAMAPSCGARLGQEQLATQKVPGADVTVSIVDSPESVGLYEPQVVHIRPGQTVGWLNASGDYHTVTFDVPWAPTSSPGFGHGATFTATFHRPGNYRYRCIYHTGMMGEVVVGGSSSPSPSAGHR